MKISFVALLRNPPPIIIYGHANQTFTVGSSAFLPCQAKGNTTPHIDWFKDGQMIQLDDPEVKSRFNQSATGSLRLSELRCCFCVL